MLPPGPTSRFLCSMVRHAAWVLVNGAVRLRTPKLGKDAALGLTGMQEKEGA